MQVLDASGHLHGNFEAVLPCEYRQHFPPKCVVLFRKPLVQVAPTAEFVDVALPGPIQGEANQAAQIAMLVTGHKSQFLRFSATVVFQLLLFNF
jgi:hypothetical protein